jgi:hypothetical protein
MGSLVSKQPIEGFFVEEPKKRPVEVIDFIRNNAFSLGNINCYPNMVVKTTGKPYSQ